MQIGIDKLGHRIKIMKEIAILNQPTIQANYQQNEHDTLYI